MLEVKQSTADKVMDEQVNTAAEERIAVVDLADEIQLRKQTIFKIVKRLGIRTSQRRESSRGNQKIATITIAEALAIKAELSRSRPLRPANDDTPTSVNESFIGEEIGEFYVIQLEPDHDAGRFKVGFSTDIDGRVRKHRCSAPFLKLVRSWPCRRTWERAAIDCATVACEQLGPEVYRAESLDDVTTRAESFFATMPQVTVAHS